MGLLKKILKPKQLYRLEQKNYTFLKEILRKKVQYSTRFRAPVNDLSQRPQGLNHAEKHYVSSQNPIERNDALPTTGGPPSRSPIGRGDFEIPKGKAALLSTKFTVEIGT